MISQTDIFKSRGYNVPTYFLDADGKKVEIETREDEEQQLAYKNIVEKLVAAGYYRAGIKGINPFDVIVGAMTWCIDDRDIDLDVDLLFKESLTIGQKIALTEKIVVVLPRLKCPYFIEPHQIQGLDFIHIYPVILWLIQWSDENRRKKANYLRSYALNQFYKIFVDPKSEKLNYLKKKALKNIQLVTHKYRDDQARSTAVTPNQSKSLLLSKIKDISAGYGLSASDKDDRVVIGPISSIEHFQENKVIPFFPDSALTNEERLNSEDADHTLNLRMQDEELDKKVKYLEDKKVKLLKEKQELEKELQTAKEESVELEKQLNEEIEDLQNLTADEKQRINDVRILIEKYDELKEKEKEFKESCKSEWAELEAEIEELEANEENLVDNEELEERLNQAKEELKKKKFELDKRTRSLQAKLRILDEIPTREELSQFQKRFLELYDEIASKNRETKRHFITYNMINDKYHYLEKEYNILNSVKENFSLVIKKAANREEFVKQLNGIASGIQHAKEKTMRKRIENKRKVEMLKDHIQYLRRQKMAYMRATRQLSDAYKKNELLYETLKRLRGED